MGRTLSLANSGGADAAFHLLELAVAPPSGSGAARSPIRRAGGRGLAGARGSPDARDAAGLAPLPGALGSPRRSAATSCTPIRQGFPAAGASPSTPMPATSGCPMRRPSGRQPRVPLPHRRNARGQLHRRHVVGGGLRGRWRVQRAHRDAVACQRRRRQLPLRAGSDPSRADRSEDLRQPVDRILAARPGLRRRDRHLLRRRHHRGRDLPHRRHRSGPRLDLRGRSDRGSRLQRHHGPLAGADQPWAAARRGLRRLRVRRAQRPERRGRVQHPRRRPAALRLQPQRRRGDGDRLRRPPLGDRPARPAHRRGRVRRVAGLRVQPDSVARRGPGAGDGLGERHAARRLHLRLDGPRGRPAPGTS